jgi:hypothetical protein
MIDDLTSKASLPLTHAVVVFDMATGEPLPLAAVEIRQDGHLIAKGNLPACISHFIAAAQAAASRAVKKEMAAELADSTL